MLGKASKFLLNMVIDPQVRKFCGPLFFSTSATTPKDNIKGSASFGLVDTGKMKLLVTCWHVVFGDGGFKEMCSQNSECRFALGIGGRFPQALSYEHLMEKKVDDEKKCDLVTFNIGDDESLEYVAASELQFYNLKANRPPQVRVGDMVYLIGFPAKGRIENDSSLGHVRQPFGVRVSQVGKFSFQSNVVNLGLNETDYGGISGAPCFTITESSGVRLVGFATGFQGNEWNNIQFTYARYIGEDGIIRYME
jgi:hypothetical protein